MSFTVRAVTVALLLPACDLVDPRDALHSCDSEPSSTSEPSSITDPAALTDIELDGLETWALSEVTFELPNDTTVVAHELGILFPTADIDRLDVVSTLTRSQDYNSSRSNRGGIVDIGDDDLDTLHLEWDGVRCVALPCESGGTERNASRRLLVEPGDALYDGALDVVWAETTPRDIDFTGSLTLGARIASHRGHVTVLKLADDGGGSIDVSSPLDEVFVWVVDPATGNPLHEAQAFGGTNPLASIAGTSGDSWPHGIRVTETAVGTLVSLTW